MKMRRDGVAPPESKDNEFTVRSATTYGITTLKYCGDGI